MFSRRTSTLSVFYLFASALLLAFYSLLIQTLPASGAQSASAVPAPIPLPEPTSPTVGEVIGNNRNMACFAGTCYFKDNGTENTTGSIAAAAQGATPTDSVSAPLVANSATLHYDVRLLWPAMIAGTSLVFLF
ncbi:hypothetical protein JB92DRAFT_3176828 [Gautieria morchelliformis]|nr:hypothetical protein JB92DRAFT_3176828 [Gautieria morchelliformis]